MPLIKNPLGAVVEVSDERYEYLVNPKPMHTDPQTGKKTVLLKQAEEQQYSKVTPEEEKAWQADQDTRFKKAKGGNKIETAPEDRFGGAKAPASPATPATHTPVTHTPAMEANVHDAEWNVEKYNALTDDEKVLYIELFETAPTV